MPGRTSPRRVFIRVVASLVIVSAIGCSEEAKHEGYCLSDLECEEGTCDPISRRCARQIDQGLLTDAELARKLDAIIVDMIVADATTSDQGLQDPPMMDATLVDMTVETPDQTLVVVDADVPPANPDMNTRDGRVAVDAAIDASQPTSDAETADEDMDASAADQQDTSSNAPENTEDFGA